MAKKNKTPKENKVENILVKIIKTGNENWFSFLSGIFANIPISLLLMLDKKSSGWLYWSLFVSAIIFSIVLVIFSIMLTIKIINIKEAAKEKYDQYVAEKKSIAPVKYTYYLKEECNRGTKFITGIGIASVASFAILIILIVILWFLI